MEDGLLGGGLPFGVWRTTFASPSHGLVRRKPSRMVPTTKSRSGAKSRRSSEDLVVLKTGPVGRREREPQECSKEETNKGGPALAITNENI